MCEKTKTCLRWVLVAIFATFFATVLIPSQGSAATGINQQISFEGKLVTASGVNVPDGTYNLEFKIYQDGTGCISSGTSPCGGTLKWTEDRLVNASKGVTVTAGTFQVNLGSVNPFGSSIDWNQDSLWLSMNVGGTTNTASPTWDGEMTPFIRLTAVPYAMNAGTVGGLSASQLVQLQTGTITNQTGGLGVTGNVQAGGTVSALAVTQNGNSVCDSSSNCTNYLSNSSGVQLQSSTPGTAQTGSFNISGTGIAGALQVASGGTIDSTSLGALNIGTTAGTSTVNIGKATQNVVMPGSLYLNGSTTATVRLSIQGTQTSSGTGYQYGFQNQINFAPSGASLTSLYGLLNIPALSSSSTPITTVVANLSRVDTTASYTGQIATAIGINSGTPSLLGTNPITNYYGIKVDNNNVNAGVSGNVATNYGIATYTPSSNSAYTTNYGLYIQGNGGASATNYSLYNASTAQSYFAGSIQSAGSLTVGPLVINSSGVVTAGTWNGATLTPGYGGTGQSSYVVGDILYASGATALSKLSDVATGSCLISGGVGVAPTWGSCGSSSGGANTALSNLASVAINTSLLPATDNSIDEGSAATSFRNGYFDSSVYSAALDTAAAGGTLSVGSTNATTVNVGPVGTTANATATNVATSTGAAQTVKIGGTGATNGSNVSTTVTLQGGQTALTTSNAGVSVQSLTASTTAFQVQNTAGVPIFLVDTNTSLSGNYLTNGGFELGTTVPTGWTAAGSPTTFVRNTAAPNHYGGQASLQIVTTATAGQGGTTTLFNSAPAAGTYTVSFYALMTSGTMSTGVNFQTSVNGGATVSCNSNNALTSTGFQRVTCPVSAGATITSLSIQQSTAVARTLYIDGVQLVLGTSATPATGSGAIQLRGAVDSPVVFQALSNSTTAFQIQNTLGTSNLFVADTLDSTIGIGTSATPGAALSVGGTTGNFQVASTGVVTGGTYNGATIGSTTFNGTTLTGTALTFTGAATIASGTSTITLGSTSTTGTQIFGPTYTSATKGVQIGASAAAAAPTLLLLNQGSLASGSETAANCSTSVNAGGLYYNTSTNAVRGCINGAWEDLVSTSGLGVMAFGVVADSGSNPGDMQSLGGTAHTSGPCKVYWTSATSVSVAPCVAYSGGHKVVVSTATAVLLTNSTAGNYQHICFSTSTGVAANTVAALTSSTEAAGLPAFSQGNPILCVADVYYAGANNTVSAIYDTRAFITTTKEFDVSSTALGLGYPACYGTSTGVLTACGTSGSQAVAGIVTASNGAASSTTPNIILATAGPTNAKSVLTGNVAGDVVMTSTTASRLTATVLPTGTLGTAYDSNLGINRIASPATACTATASVANCDYQFFFSQQKR